MNCRISNVATTATLAGLLAALMAASPAGAVDGVIEINQARAVAGGITPGDTPDYPVTISQGGSYRLTGALVSAAGPVIDITSEDVTLDLNGFKISLFLFGCSGPNIRSSASRTKLYNGIVQCGVEVGPGAHVEGLSIIDGDLLVTSMNLGEGAAAIVIRNRVSGRLACRGLCTIRENRAGSIDGTGVVFFASTSLCSDNLLSGVIDGCKPEDANQCCPVVGAGFPCFSCP